MSNISDVELAGGKGRGHAQGLGGHYGGIVCAPSLVQGGPRSRQHHGTFAPARERSASCRQEGVLWAYM